MGIRTIQADGTLSAAPADEGVISKVIDTVKVPFMADNEVLDASGAFWAMATTATVSGVASSMLARKNAAAGKEPFLKILF